MGRSPRALIPKPYVCTQDEDDQLETLAAKVRKTRRPEYEALAAVARSAAAMPVRLPAEAPLLQLLADFEAWEVRAP